MGRYSLLGERLRALGRERIEMTFEEIERILGFTLPRSAAREPLTPVAGEEVLDGVFGYSGSEPLQHEHGLSGALAVAPATVELLSV